MGCFAPPVYYCAAPIKERPGQRLALGVVLMWSLVLLTLAPALKALALFKRFHWPGPPASYISIGLWLLALASVPVVFCSPPGLSKISLSFSSVKSSRLLIGNGCAPGLIAADGHGPPCSAAFSSLMYL